MSRAVVSAPGWLVDRLDLGLGARVLHLTCLHSADGLPSLHEDRWINLAVTPGAEAADFLTVGPTEWLVAAVPFSVVEISFQAVAADPGMAGHLRCAPGDALFQAERATRWEGRAVTFVRLTHAPGYRMTTRY